VIIPQENMRELKDMPKNITQHLQIEPVSKIEEVLKLALVRDVKTRSRKKPVKSTKNS
jgi:ATP-dependent Lon protease